MLLALARPRVAKTGSRVVDEAQRDHRPATAAIVRAEEAEVHVLTVVTRAARYKREPRVASRLPRG